MRLHCKLSLPKDLTKMNEKLYVYVYISKSYQLHSEVAHHVIQSNRWCQREETEGSGTKVPSLPREVQETKVKSTNYGAFSLKSPQYGKKPKDR